jgi:hypothetical protein
MKKKKQPIFPSINEVFNGLGVMADLDNSVTNAFILAVTRGMPPRVALVNVIGSIKHIMERSGMNDQQIRDAFSEAFNMHARIREEVKKRLG